MFDIASSTALFQSSLVSASGMIGTVILGVLGVALGLLGLGFGWRHLKKYVTGRKF